MGEMKHGWRWWWDATAPFRYIAAVGSVSVPAYWIGRRCGADEIAATIFAFTVAVVVATLAILGAIIADERADRRADAGGACPRCHGEGEIPPYCESVEGDQGHCRE